jgi:osmotically-inducible protein OsmY
MPMKNKLSKINTINKFKIIALIALANTGILLTGCAPIAIGAIGVAAVSAIDRRPTNIQTTDKGLQVQILSELKRDYYESSIEVAVWNGRVLLVGNVATQAQKDSITAKYSSTNNVKYLFNEVKVGYNPAIITRTGDGLLTARIRSELLAAQGVNSSSVKVVTEGNKVYLLGWLTQAELERVVSISRQTYGVNEVVNLTEIVDKI